MTFFSEYVKSIVSAGLCAFLCESVYSHFSKNKAMEKAMKLITGLCIFTIAISPLFSLINNDFSHHFDFSESTQQNNSKNSFYTLTQEEAEKILSNKIFTEIGIKVQYLRIELEYSNNSIEIKSITAAVNKDEITKVEEYLKNNFAKDEKTVIMVKADEQN